MGTLKKKFVSQCSEGRIETLVIFKGLSTLTLSFFFSSFLIPSPAVSLSLCLQSGSSNCVFPLLPRRSGRKHPGPVALALSLAVVTREKKGKGLASGAS